MFFPIQATLAAENRDTGRHTTALQQMANENLAANQERMAEVRERRENATRAAMLARNRTLAAEANETASPASLVERHLVDVGSPGALLDPANVRSTQPRSSEAIQVGMVQKPQARPWSSSAVSTPSCPIHDSCSIVF